MQETTGINKSLERMLRIDDDEIDINFIKNKNHTRGNYANKTSDTLDPPEKKQTLLATKVLERVLASANSPSPIQQQSDKQYHAHTDSTRTRMHKNNNNFKNVDHHSSSRKMSRNPS